jgi:pyruvate kinase
MTIIATLPPPYAEDLFRDIINTPRLNQVRFNTGCSSPDSPKDTLSKVLEASHLPVWVDLKCRQLRIKNWAVPTYGDIELSHEIEVDLPARIYFRGGSPAIVRRVEGNKIYVDPPPKQAVGRGQSVNITGKNLKIKGYLTEQDLEYIEAAKALGCNLFMASFVETLDDVKVLRESMPDGLIGLKIESEAGVDLITSYASTFKVWGEGCQIVAARDDLFVNLSDKGYQEKFYLALSEMIRIDPEAILASRLMESLLKSNIVSVPDLSDALLVKQMGYRNFLLSDELNKSPEALRQAVYHLWSIQRWGTETVRP